MLTSMHAHADVVCVCACGVTEYTCMHIQWCPNADMWLCIRVLMVWVCLPPAPGDTKASANYKEQRNNLHNLAFDLCHPWILFALIAAAQLLSNPLDSTFELCSAESLFSSCQFLQLTRPGKDEHPLSMHGRQGAHRRYPTCKSSVTLQSITVALGWGLKKLIRDKAWTADAKPMLLHSIIWSSRKTLGCHTLRSWNCNHNCSQMQWWWKIFWEMQSLMWEEGGCIVGNSRVSRRAHLGFTRLKSSRCLSGPQAEWADQRRKSPTVLTQQDCG